MASKGVYKGADGIDRPAPRTFDSKQSADRWLTLTEAEIIRGDWSDPEAGRVSFGDYAASWIDERAGLRPRTIELYRYLLRRHLMPTFAATRAGSKGASVERSPERPVLSIRQVFGLAEVIAPRYRALVLLHEVGDSQAVRCG